MSRIISKTVPHPPLPHENTLPFSFKSEIEENISRIAEKGQFFSPLTIEEKSLPSGVIDQRQGFEDY